MKNLLKKFLVCILIIILMSNFIFNGICNNYVYADGESGDEISAGPAISNVLTGLIGLLLYPFTILPTAILIGVSGVVSAVAKLSINDFTSGAYTNAIGKDAMFITPFDILFNRVPLVDVNFFNLDSVKSTSTIGLFRQSVAGWYYTMRLLASMVLLVILIYIGIRMATTSIATEKAIYKKMLVDWVTSIALLFLLHYIILFVFEVNESLVNAMSAVAEGNFENYSSMMSALQGKCFDIDIVVRLTALFIYGMLIFQTISFLVAYIKRMFTIGFLIIIAPLITITYSMDKIGDGKSQALNTWLKEFIYNILLQPFQCILYMVFAKLTLDSMLSIKAFNLSHSNIGTAVFAILSLHFIKDGEKIIKKIFGFENASTAGDLVAATALTGAALIKGKDVAKNTTKSAIVAGRKLSSGVKSIKGGIKKAGKKLDNISKSIEENNKGNKLGNALSNHRKNREERYTRRKEKNDEKNQKKETRFEERVQKKAEKEWRRAGNSGPVSKEQLEKTREELKNQKISGFTGRIKNSTPGKVIGALNEVYQPAKKLVKDLGFDKLPIMALGAGFGMAATGASGAIAGGGMGAGVVDGYRSASAKTIMQETIAAAQCYANLTGNTDNENIINSAVEAGLNDIAKSISDLTNKLTGELRNHQGGVNSLDEFTRLAMSKEHAGSLTKEGIREILEKNNFDGDMDKTVEQFSQYGALIAQQTIARNSDSALNIGIDSESLANRIGKLRTPEESNSTRTQTFDSTDTYESTETFEREEETIHESLDSSSTQQLVNSILSQLEVSSSRNINSLQIDEVNRNIDNLNKLINELKSKDDQVRSDILSAVNLNNQTISDHNISLESLEGQLHQFEARKAEIQGQNS